MGCVSLRARSRWAADGEEVRNCKVRGAAWVALSSVSAFGVLALAHNIEQGGKVTALLFKTR